MKNHKNFIKIVIVIAVLAACGYAACRYVRAHNNQAKENVLIQMHGNAARMSSKPAGSELGKVKSA